VKETQETLYLIIIVTFV